MEQPELDRALADIARNLPLLGECCAPIGGIAEALVALALATNEMVEHFDEFRLAAAGLADDRGPVPFVDTGPDEGA